MIGIHAPAQLPLVLRSRGGHSPVAKIGQELVDVPQRKVSCVEASIRVRVQHASDQLLEPVEIGCRVVPRASDCSHRPCTSLPISSDSAHPRFPFLPTSSTAHSCQVDSQLTDGGQARFPQGWLLISSVQQGWETASFDQLCRTRVHPVLQIGSRVPRGPLGVDMLSSSLRRAAVQSAPDRMAAAGVDGCGRAASAQFVCPCRGRSAFGRRMHQAVGLKPIGTFPRVGSSLVSGKMSHSFTLRCEKRHPSNLRAQRVRPNPSIERTSTSGLRPLAAAAHVKR